MFVNDERNLAFVTFLFVVLISVLVYYAVIRQQIVDVSYLVLVVFYFLKYLWVKGIIKSY